MAATTFPPTVAPPLRAPILPSSGSRVSRLGCPFPPPSPHAIVDAPYQTNVSLASMLIPIPQALSPSHPLSLVHRLQALHLSRPLVMPHAQGFDTGAPYRRHPNSIFSDEAFKGLREFSALDSGDEEEVVGKEVIGEGRSGDKNNLTITNLGLQQPLVN